MPYYRYYQTNEKERWEFAIDQDEETLKELGAKRVSILSVDQAVDTLEDKKSVKYKGNMYFDIDSKDLSKAIKSTQELVAKLQHYGIEEENMHLFCSGSKGFHVIVHYSAFYERNTGKKYLPRIYKKIAAHFHVPGLDYQPYSAGKGNLFRLPNVQRDDGKYKVQITLSELQEMSPDRYEALTSEPRTDLSFMPLKKVRTANARLYVLFQEAEKEVKDEILIYDDIEGISKDRLNSSLSSVPVCIQQLADGEVKPGTNFNQAALQMAAFLARYDGDKEEKSSLVNRMADNYNSTSYTNTATRISHLRGLLGYVSSGNGFPFACGPVKTILKSNPCESCPLLGVSTESVSEEDPFIVEDSKGYRLKSRGMNKRLTNFILIPIKEISNIDNDSGKEVRHKIECNVYMGNEFLGVAEMYNDTWSSRATFLKAFNEVSSNVAAFCNDQEVQMLKEYVLQNLEEVDYQIQVEALGVYRDKPGGKIRYTWIEPTMSVNRFGMLDTHTYARDRSHGRMTEDRLKSLPAFSKIPPAVPGDKDAERAVHALLNMNAPATMAPILGWIAACNLKSHFMGRFGQFPLLNLWGGRGSGKTRTATIVTALSGCNYMEHSPHVASSTTLFPVYAEMSSTTTIPRVIDEFNRLGCGITAYNKITEAMKQAYNGASVHRGAISRGNDGAIISEMKMTSPILYLSEHIPEVPALQDRTVSVMMSEKNLRSRKKYERHLGRHFEDLYPVARALAMKTLSLHEDGLLEEIELYEDQISDELSDRQRFGSAVVMVGLDYLRKTVCEDLGMVGLEAKIEELKAAYFGMVGKGSELDESFRLVGGGNATEIDAYLRALSELVILSQADPLVSGPTPQSLSRSGDILKIDVPVIFALLQRYLHMQGGRRPLSEAAQFKVLLYNEPYYEGEEVDMSMTQDRPVLLLSLPKMAKKGIEISCY